MISYHKGESRGKFWLVQNWRIMLRAKFKYTNINVKIEEYNEWKIKEINNLCKEKFVDFLKYRA
jgi:hypothetical protein